MTNPVAQHFTALCQRLHERSDLIDARTGAAERAAISTVLSYCEQLQLSRCTPAAWSQLWVRIDKAIAKGQDPKTYEGILSDMEAIATGGKFDPLPVASH